MSDGSEVVRLEQRTPFTMIDNPIIRALDDYVALGLYVDMLSWPPGWRLNLREMTRTHRQGRTVLTAAMNELIERGLVFRVRYQGPGGQWMTRTYVCAAPVTLDELLDVRRQYADRCKIETSTALTAQANPGRRVAGQKPSTVQPDRSPSVRFPSVGDPNPGEPNPGDPDPGPTMPGEPPIGEPTIGDLAPQRSDSRSKTPPPPTPANGPDRPSTITNPSDPSDPAPPQRAAPQSALPQAAVSQSDGADPRLVAAIRAAWPNLNESGLAQLGPDLVAATAAIGAAPLLEHLTTNTGGALNPVAVLRTRLRNLPPPPRITRSVAWCGRCSSPTYRWVEDASGFPIEPCPRCSGQARAKGQRGGGSPTTVDGAGPREHDAPPDRQPLRPTG